MGEWRPHERVEATVSTIPMDYLHNARVTAGKVALNIITCFLFSVSVKVYWMSVPLSNLSKHQTHSSRRDCFNLSSY